MITWSPQPGPQTALVTCPVEDILYGGARGGGKTDGFLGKWLQRSTKYGGNSKGLFVRRSMPELDEVIARSHEIYLPIGALYRAQKSTWIMPDGALLRLRSLGRDADAGKYQGHSYTDVYIDEAGNFPPASELPAPALPKSHKRSSWRDTTDGNYQYLEAIFLAAAEAFT